MAAVPLSIMQAGSLLFPDRASTLAGEVDALYGFLIAMSVFFTAGIFALVVYFAARYRRARVGPRATRVSDSVRLEVLWTVVPFLISMVAFTWGAVLFFDSARPPARAVDFHLTAKQWMWRIQHPTGHREINELHMPVETPVALRMRSEDVIHSFSVPAFRTKQDVLPGTESVTWFEATRTGSFPFFCAEYCGTKHAQMIGSVHVLEPDEYQRWLEGRTAAETPEETGQRLFSALRCDSCHTPGARQQGPLLEGRFGSPVALQDGGTTRFDEEYVRESILDPMAKVAAGFDPVMPTYAGQVGEEDLRGLVAYLRSLEQEVEE